MRLTHPATALVAIQHNSAVHQTATRGRAALLAAWLAWTGWLALHYFTVPANWVDLFEGDIGGMPHLGEAVVRAASALAGAAFVLLGAWGAGAIVVRPRIARIFDGVWERWPFQLALGCAALAYVLLLLATFGAFTRSAVLATVGVAAIVGGASMISRFRTRRGRSPDLRRPRLDRLGLICALAAGAFALVAALAPETEYDALWYHLWLPLQWLEAGQPVDLVEEYVSLYPLTWDLLYGAAIVVSGPVAAKLLHLACLPLVGVATWQLTRLIFPGASAGLATALAVTAPTLLWEATTAYVDLALAWYVALGAHALWQAHRTRARGWLILAALMFGVAAAIKHLALLYLAVGAGSIVASELMRTRSVLRSARAGAMLVILALLIASPWYARAYARAGNPVFPDLYGVFGAAPAARWNDRTQAGLERFQTRFGRERSAGNLSRLPWDMTVHGASYRGTFGPLFLALAPFAVFSGSRARALLVAVAAVLALWASPVSSFQLRFLVPLVPMLAVLAAEAARLIPGSAVVIVPLLVLNLPPFIPWHEADRRGDEGWLTHVVRGLPIRVVLGMESQDEYLSRAVPSYRAWRFADGVLPSDARVLTFSGGDHLYSSRSRLWSEAAVAAPLTWQASAGEEREVLKRLKEAGVTHVLFDLRRVGSGEMRPLAIGSEAMIACCLERLYGDTRFALYTVR